MGEDPALIDVRQVLTPEKMVVLWMHSALVPLQGSKCFFDESLGTSRSGEALLVKTGRLNILRGQ